MLAEAAHGLVERYDSALLDLDGVVYLGTTPVPHAVPALLAARTAGMRLAYVTNNASRTPVQVAEVLSRIGLAVSPGEITTSGEALLDVLARELPVDSTVLVCGSPGLASQVREAGWRVVPDASAAPGGVVVGYDPELTYARLAEAALAIGQGARWVCTNADVSLPSPRGRLPGTGSIAAALRAATGRTPLIAGKPGPALHRLAAARSGGQHPLVVGDRLDTDIEGAWRAGFPSLLVLSGVTTPAELLAAPPRRRPDYVGRDLRALHEAHPRTLVGPPGHARCGAARAVADAAGLVTVTLGRGGAPGSLDGLDPLRAAAAACWTAPGPRSYRLRRVQGDLTSAAASS